MTKLNDIRVALENHLATADMVLPDVAWPNVPYKRDPQTSFIRVEFLPLVRRPVTAGPAPEQRRSGLLMLTVFTPEGRGAAEGTLLAEQIEERFSGSTSIVTPEVIVRLEYSEAKRPLHDPPFYAIPVEIGWYAYHQ